MTGEATWAQEGKDRKVSEPQTPSGPAGREQPVHAASGEMTLREHVVAKIAGLATREVEGVHSMGRGGWRENLFSGDDVRRGVKVTVGQKEAAFDLWLKVEYGCHIPDVVDLVRQRITERVSAMTGLHTKEVNINVVDVVLPGQEPKSAVE